MRLRAFGARPPKREQAAQQDRLERYSAALLLFEAGGGLAVGSAVAIRLEGHLLLATAGHNLTGIHHPRRLWALLRYDVDLLVPVRVRAFGGRMEQGDRDLIDVGWVELEPDSGTDDLLHFLGPEQLAGDPPEDPLPTEAPGTRYLVHGVPAHLVQVEDGCLHRRLTLTPLSLLTETVASSVAQTPKPTDIALDYGPRTLPPAPGLSGGGIWRADPVRRTAPCLVGITRGWWPRSRQLRGTPIHHWLKAVEEDLLASKTSQIYVE